MPDFFQGSALFLSNSSDADQSRHCGAFLLPCQWHIQVRARWQAGRARRRRPRPGSDSSGGGLPATTRGGPRPAGGLSLPVPWRLPTRSTAAAQNGRQRRIEWAWARGQRHLCSARSCQSTGRGIQRPVSSMAGPEEPGLGPKLVTAVLSTFFIHFVVKCLLTTAGHRRAFGSRVQSDPAGHTRSSLLLPACETPRAALAGTLRRRGLGACIGSTAPSGSRCWRRAPPARR
jgi:hypothetical protein